MVNSSWFENVYIWAWYALPLITVVSASVTPFILFWRTARQFRNEDPPIEDMPLRLKDLRRQCFQISILLGVFVLITLAWAIFALRFAGTSSAASYPLAIFLNGVGPVAALLFFSFQVIAGSLFATLSVSATATRIESQPNSILLQVNLERGDKWLIEVPRVTFSVADGPRQEFKFPRRTVSPTNQKVSWLRLGPGEKTASMQVVDFGSLPMATIDVRAESYALWWPAPSMSFCRVIVPRFTEKDQTLNPYVVGNTEHRTG